MQLIKYKNVFLFYFPSLLFLSISFEQEILTLHDFCLRFADIKLQRNIGYKKYNMIIGGSKNTSNYILSTIFDCLNLWYIIKHHGYSHGLIDLILKFNTVINDQLFNYVISATMLNDILEGE